jgi:peptidoglycan/xylan/chitin deacetylase (PgdA/CDA1 family)
MIIAVDVSDSVRRRYEDHFVSRLAATGVDAVPSYRAMPREEKLTREEVAQVVSELNANSVVVTRIVGEKDKMRYEQPAAYPNYYRNFYGMYDWSYTYARGPGYVSNYMETYLETNLYDAESEKLIWSGQKSVTDDRSEKKNIESVVSAVISDLRKQGMIGSSGR